MGSGSANLLVIPPVTAERGSDNSIRISHKFLTGLEAYGTRWPGKVQAIVPVYPSAGKQLDLVEYQAGKWPFELIGLHPDRTGTDSYIPKVSLGLLGDEALSRTWATTFRRLNIPYVHVVETSPKTRRQIIAHQTPGLLRRMKRIVWSEFGTRRQSDSFRNAAGLQCNGTPAYEAYGPLNPRSLLFFDSRVSHDLIIDPGALKTRLARLSDPNRPLRLVFSGRLIRIKGADHLPRVAARLKELGMKFSMDLCGAGDLGESLAAEIRQRGLDAEVRLRGSLDFSRELIPFVKNETDLFVCCHRQGDPSCTYHETLSCGVPIVGYGNEALRGIVDRSGAGWWIDRDDPAKLAALIHDLDRDRARLAAASEKARAFAVEHTFERTMDQRVRHLVECAAPRPGG